LKEDIICATPGDGEFVLNRTSGSLSDSAPDAMFNLEILKLK
jgi:hypothetical protein